MSSLRIAEFHCFEVDETRTDCRIVVTWEKEAVTASGLRLPIPGIVVEHHFKYRNQATDIVSTELIKSFEAGDKGQDAALRKALQVFKGKRAEYQHKYCTKTRYQ